MTSPEFDLLVVGGGIQGAGVLQAAAARGWKAELVERRSLAIGTSSRSSKLIHGGLRYLESAQFSLVRESLRERAILLRIAPHLVRLVPFHLPIYRHTSRGPWKIRAGLSLYALLAGFGPGSTFSRVSRRDWRGLDDLVLDDLREVFVYFDGQTDDADLTRAVAASAEELGARVHEHTELLEAQREHDGWRVRVAGPEGERDLRARVVVCAGGPWLPKLLDRFQPAELRQIVHRDVQMVGGTHIELPGRLERGVYYLEAPSDQRAVFAIPWRDGQTGADRVMVGTTERIYTEDPAHVLPTREEIDYLVKTYAHYFPSGSREVSESWAGLRVLPGGSGKAFHRPREVILATDASAPSLLAIHGGKLTGYRATAEKVVQKLSARLGPAKRRADTRTLRLPELADPSARVPARSSLPALRSLPGEPSSRR